MIIAYSHRKPFPSTEYKSGAEAIINLFYGDFGLRGIIYLGQPVVYED